MTITVLCPSPLDNDPAVRTLLFDYIKRMDDHVILKTPKCKTATTDTPDTVKKKQSAVLCTEIAKLPSSAYVIALDERGQTIDSPTLAQKLSQVRVNGFSDFCFVIGGAYGLADEVTAACHYKLSLGKMVWPHRLVGLMLVEQIYRAQQINKGHPYHKH